MKQYIVLAHDSVRNDTLVFITHAPDAAHARRLVDDYYCEQDWTPGPSSMTVRSVKDKSVQFIGHAQEEYQELQRQIEVLCAKLLEQADGADLTVERDALSAFVAQFAQGERRVGV